MTQIRLRNTKTRTVEDFTPIDPNNVRMYLCGPTVYDRAHLGNARPVVVFDVLYRLLREIYGADHVTYVRNFTDVDDKINATALARKEAGAEGSLEDLIRERTEETIGWYHADMDALGALRPTVEPRATDYIGAMIAMIEDLIAKGHAYAKDGHVLFRVRSYRNYGALSGRSVDDMIAGARVEVAPFKEDPMDFVLWKPSDDGLPGWDSPWGRGRPGWHIECSAMSEELLWKKPLAEGRLSEDAQKFPHVFDIHGGGIDLQFPHHENEIAQSCCAHSHADGRPGEFARIWIHNEMLQVEGKKMSKSLGNFFTVRDLLDGHDGEPGIPGEVIRFVFLQTHYSKPMDWTAEKARQAEKMLDYLYEAVGDTELDESIEPDSLLVEALSNDLNTKVAFDQLHGAAVAWHIMTDGRDEVARKLKRSANLLGLLAMTRSEWLSSKGGGADLSGLADKLASLRATAMDTKDFAPVDALKAALVAAGVEVRMSKAGVELLPGPGFDASKLEGL
ncbi:cysteine--tRNA ligase [Pseudothioclava arenosa]|uniref:Cysteine--tRNA ligase n=1 Tax=Pseudothioclava arenosa TaxID=1795308 RepID=A0A2A4CRQ2_9RHOB|nr:cysteine--tRNA ligase [Pseudothioclava arenosa]PCD76932.1 cysteine--tRNA ligase [Pseudothioclava arenosa]